MHKPTHRGQVSSNVVLGTLPLSTRLTSRPGRNTGAFYTGAMGYNKKRIKTKWDRLQHGSKGIDIILNYLREWHVVCDKDLKRLRNKPGECEARVRAHMVEAFLIWIERNIQDGKF